MSQPHPGNPAETYENYFVPAMFHPWAAILLRHAAPKLGERVLDVACGTGVVARMAAPLVGPNGQVVGLDMNPAMLAVARQLPAPSGATITWQDGNAMAPPFTDGAFDLVLCQHGLQFFPDRSVAIGEMRRVLAPRGRALAIVLQTLARHPVYEALWSPWRDTSRCQCPPSRPRSHCLMPTRWRACIRRRDLARWTLSPNRSRLGFPNQNGLCHLP
jgi:SAM-dependent methyltransferase